MIQILPLAILDENVGQIQGINPNPRKIDTDKFEQLKENIKTYPEMLIYSSMKVYPCDNGRYIVIGGNMRLRAMRELGLEKAPCSIIDKDTTFDEINAYVILDNVSFGRWDWDRLSNEWDEQKLLSWGVDIPTIGNDSIDGLFDDEKQKDNEDDDIELVIKLSDEFIDEKDIIVSKLKVLLSKYDGLEIK